MNILLFLKHLYNVYIKSLLLSASLSNYFHRRYPLCQKKLNLLVNRWSDTKCQGYALKKIKRHIFSHIIYTNSERANSDIFGH